MFDWRVIKDVGFKLLGKTYVQSGVSMGVRRTSWVRESIQEVGCSSSR